MTYSQYSSRMFMNTVVVFPTVFAAAGQWSLSILTLLILVGTCTFHSLLNKYLSVSKTITAYVIGMNVIGYALAIVLAYNESFRDSFILIWVVMALTYFVSENQLYKKLKKTGELPESFVNL